MNVAIPRRFVVLVGLMGVGKTSVGRALAGLLGWRLSDSDEELLARTGHSARELKQRIGADALHELEAEHLLRALAGERPAVVCAAASTVELQRCRAALAGGAVFTVWLRASSAELARRFGSDPHRPMYGEDPAGFLQEQLRSREALFRTVAQLTLDSGAATPAELAQQIVAELGMH